MKKKLRKIVVHNLEFEWHYQQCVQHLPNHTSRLVIFRKADDVNIEIFFFTEDTWIGGNPLNEGLPVIKEGNEKS